MLTRLIIPGESPRLLQEVIDDPSIKYARVNHQFDRPGLDPDKFVPDAIKMYGQSYGDQKGNDIPWLKWWKHCKDINADNPGAWEWLTTLEAMLFNKDGTLGQIDTTQKISALCQMCGGNLIQFRTETANSVLVFSYQWDMDTSILTAQSPLEHPEYYWYGCAVNGHGTVRKLTNGIKVIVPQVARGQKWLHKDQITILDRKPDTWTFENVLMP